MSGEPTKRESAPPPGEAQKPAAPPAASKSGGGGSGFSLRTGGCLIAIVVFLFVLGGVALLYRPPPAHPSGLATAAHADAGPTVRLPAIRAVAVSPDGTMIAYGGDAAAGGRHQILLRRIQDGKFVDRDAPHVTIAAHDDLVSALRFRPDGRELLSASQDGTVGWWRVDDGSRLGTLVPPGDRHGLLALAVSPDGRLVAAGGWAGDVDVWNLATPAAAPLVLRGTHAPWPSDPDKLVPAGQVEEVRNLVFVPGDPPLLISGGGEGLLVAWDPVQGRAGRVVGVDGRTPSVRALLLRQIEHGRDAEFVIVSTMADPQHNGVLASDYRGCVVLLTTDGPCRDWWLGGASPGAGCLRPLLDNKKICVPLDRPPGEGATAFFGLATYPGIVGGFIGATLDEHFRLFRATDQRAWREFNGAGGSRASLSAFAAVPGGTFVLVGSRDGALRIYDFAADPNAPDVALGDHLP